MYLKVVTFRVFNKDAVEYILDFKNLTRREVEQRIVRNIYSTAVVAEVETYKLEKVDEPFEIVLPPQPETHTDSKEETVANYKKDFPQANADKA